MLNGLITLDWYGSYYTGGQIGDLLAQLQNTGFFSYVLPFLLIFAVIFGILSRINIFSQKGDKNKSNNSINAIISLVVALMALQFELVPQFFSEIFPQLGVGLSIILLMIILLGLFAPDETWMHYTFFGIAAIIFIVIVVKASSTFGFYSGGGYIWDQYGGLIIVGIVLLVFIATILGASNPKSKSGNVSSAFRDALFGGN